MNKTTVEKFLEMFGHPATELPGVFSREFVGSPSKAAVNSNPDNDLRKWVRSFYLYQNGIEHQHERLIPAHSIIVFEQSLLAMFAKVREPGICVLITEVEFESLRAIQIVSGQDASDHPDVFVDLL